MRPKKAETAVHCQLSYHEGLGTSVLVGHFRITLHCLQTETSSRGQVLKVQQMYEKLALSLDLKVLFISSGA